MVRFLQEPMAKNQQDKPKPAEKPISLKPLKVEEALSEMLKVKPSRREPENLKRSEKGETS